jgi:hypothetical protein
MYTSLGIPTSPSSPPASGECGLNWKCTNSDRNTLSLAMMMDMVNTGRLSRETAMTATRCYPFYSRPMCNAAGGKIMGCKWDCGDGMSLEHPPHLHCTCEPLDSSGLSPTDKFMWGWDMHVCDSSKDPSCAKREAITNTMTFCKSVPRPGSTTGGGPVAGFGADMTAASIMQVPGMLQGMLGMTVMGVDGIRRFKPEVTQTLMRGLPVFGSTFLSDVLVKIFMFEQASIDAAKTDENYRAFLESTSAYTWVNQKVLSGHAIFAPLAILYPTAETLSAGLMLGAVKLADVERMKQMSTLPIGAFFDFSVPSGAVLEEGEEAKKSSSVTSWVLLAGAAVLAGYVVYQEFGGAIR